MYMNWMNGQILNKIGKYKNEKEKNVDIIP